MTLVTITVHGDHVILYPSIGKDESWVQTAKDMKPINQLLFMDELKLNGASKHQLE